MAAARCAIGVAPALCSVSLADRAFSVKHSPIFLDSLAEQIDGAVDAKGQLTGATTLHAEWPARRPQEPAGSVQSP
jgi:hypothetical protein